jgi:AcrR family transcriptional regulator
MGPSGSQVTEDRSDVGSTSAQPRRGTARERVLEAAVDLFAEHGVSGTSLQMIADRLGVTKAAVYHQFQTKEDIVLGLIEPALEHLSSVVAAAGAARSRSAAVDLVLRGLIDLMVDNRGLANMLFDDPTVGHVVRTHPLLEQAAARFTEVLTGPDPDEDARIRASMVGGSLKAAGDPALLDIDPQVLRDRMLESARRLLGVARQRATAPESKPAGIS